MQFLDTPLAGVVVIEIESHEDERGAFGRTWCADEARSRGLQPHFDQCSVSYNRWKGTLRGLHFQREPHAESKLVRCTAGAIYDVVVDIRPLSPSYRGWIAYELTAANRRALYVPPGCAHGFQTLTDGAEVYYQISPPYRSESAGGVRWDDPAIGVQWPEVPRLMSERDRSWPSLPV